MILDDWSWRESQLIVTLEHTNNDKDQVYSQEPSKAEAEVKCIRQTDRKSLRYIQQGNCLPNESTYKVK